MKAAYYEQTGGPEVIRYGDLPTPAPGPGQVLVKMAAVALNPIDVFIRSGTAPVKLNFPFVPGGDLAGTVEAVGSGASRFQPGDRVWCAMQGVAGRQGIFAEYSAIDEAWLNPMPQGADFQDMAALALVSLTAHIGLFERAGLKAGETVFVTGGTGGVGSQVVQQARAAGARVITTAGDAAKAAKARELGADEVILYKTENLAEKIKAFAPQGINVWYETAQQPDLATNVTLLAQHGRMVFISGRAAEPKLPIGPFYTRGASLLGTALLIMGADELRPAAEQVNAWVAAGRLKPLIDRVMHLRETAEAHRLQEESTIGGAGRLAGKIVLVL